jgi:hypothetical protein
VCFRLIYGDSDLQLELPFDSHIEERLSHILGRSDPPQMAERRRLDLARYIVEHVTALLEGNVLPPSENQLKYAVAIAATLELELPADVLKYRDAMGVFLSKHAAHYHRIKASKNPARDTSS